MRLYADRPARRARQLAADVGLLAWLAVWLLVARTVHRAVLQLAGPGQQVERLGDSISDAMGDAADAAGRVPVAGGALSRPLDALGDAGGAVAGTGQGAQDAVHTLATVLAVVLVVLPVGWALSRWLPGRLRWSREATAARRVLGSPTAPDLELLAARALATAPLPELARLPAGTGARWRDGDPRAVAALAELELARLGLRAPSAAPRAATRAG
ncbi:hypothetical protein [Modestobacter sp. NPDC049651]|uniref:hypothetical protein n=1 Tax=unclassified Modestobacter TaxID=2643866 RepID=UPI0033F5A4D0